MTTPSRCAMSCWRKVAAVASDFQPTLRLHGASWLFGLTGAIKQLVLPLIALFFFGVRDNDPNPMQPFVVPIIIAALLIRALSDGCHIRQRDIHSDERGNTGESNAKAEQAVHGKSLVPEEAHQRR